MTTYYLSLAAIVAAKPAAQIIVTWMALRKADSRDVHKTMSAIAELFRWWRIR